MEVVNHVGDRMVLYLLAGNGGVGFSDARKEQLQVIVDFSGGTDGGTRVFGAHFLLDGNGRRYALDVFYFGLFHAAKKLPGVGTQAFHIHALPLRKERVKGQGRFPRA